VEHIWEDVPGFGKVVISRHAQERAERDNISERLVEEILWTGEDTPDGTDTMWREKKGFRLVIIRPDPWKGAFLVTTMYRVKAQARVRH